MSVEETVGYLSVRVAAAEREIAHLYRHLGIQPPPPPDPADEPSPRVVEHIRAGRMIAAIKQLRDETGTDLVTAKQRVEELAARGYGGK